jgi:UPF0755 protein
MRVLSYSLLLALAFFTLLFVPGPLKSDTSIVISHGSLLKASETLKENNTIYSSTLFFIPAKTINYFKTLKAGEYVFNKHASLFDIISKMKNGDVVFHKLIIPEGLTSKEVINLINSNLLLSGTLPDSNFYEGIFLPETYYFTRGEQKQVLVSRMQNAMKDAIDKLWQARSLDTPLKTKEELVILASIVEKEAKTPEDRKHIASVFLNRLKKGMKLQADPTVIYAITKGQYKLERTLFTKDLSVNSPWNTYYTIGLPPTPIANPGLESLIAIIQPSETDYLFFVVNDCKGSHAFASNLNIHNKNVSFYRKLSCRTN